MFFKKKGENSEIANETLVEKERELLVKKRDDEGEALYKLLKKTNSLLMYITELDYVQDMLVDVNKQSEMVEGIAASSQEMTAAIEDISNHVQSSHMTTSNAINAANDTIELITLSYKQIEETFNESKKVQSTMHKVSDEAKKIGEMVSIINKVAEQTNLLALNASIEAARAGEHGKGFAVVADEMKKLSDNTKEQVKFIKSIVDSLGTEINNADKALDKANISFDKGKQKMEEAVNSLDTMKDGLNDIDEAFIEISANVEEQTASSEEMSSSVMIANEKTQSLREETGKTGDAFNEVSILVDELRIQTLRATRDKKDIEPNTLIEICISDHLMWRWRIYNMILGYKELDGKKIGTHHTCRLGKWLDTLGIKDSRKTSIINKMEKPHSELHVYAKEAISAYNGGNIQKAREAFDSMDKASKETIEYLKDLKLLFD